MPPSKGCPLPVGVVEGRYQADEQGQEGSYKNSPPANPVRERFTLSQNLGLLCCCYVGCVAHVFLKIQEFQTVGVEIKGCPVFIGCLGAASLLRNLIGPVVSLTGSNITDFIWSNQFSPTARQSMA